MGSVQVAVPEDLNELIARRLDKAVWDSKQRKGFFWPAWMKALALGAVGCAAISGVFLSLTHRNVGPVGAGFGNSGDSFKISSTSGGVLVKFAPTSRQTLVVKSEP